MAAAAAAAVVGPEPEKVEYGKVEKLARRERGSGIGSRATRRRGSPQHASVRCTSVREYAALESMFRVSITSDAVSRDLAMPDAAMRESTRSHGRHLSRRDLDHVPPTSRGTTHCRSTHVSLRAAPDDPYVFLFRTTWLTPTTAALNPNSRVDLPTARRLIDYGKTDNDAVRAALYLFGVAAAARSTDPSPPTALGD
ncbi:hypothetical protein GGF32_008325, partial [Allomyces javanicus]